MQPNLTMVLEQVGKDKGIDVKILLQTLEQAILTAAKKAFGMHREMEAQYNEETGAVDLFQIINVVEGPDADRGPRDHDRPTPRRTASRPSSATSCCSRSSIAPRTPTAPRSRTQKYGDLLDLHDASKTFGRIAAQTAKQVIIQRVREAERENVFNEYKDRKGELISGIVRRFERGNLIVDLGRAEAILPVREQVPRESYRVGDRIMAYVRRHRQERARPADHPVAHAQGPAREAVRAGGARRSTRRSCASRRRPASRARARRSPCQLARPRRRSGRRLRRHEGLARAGGRAGAARREDRHRPVRSTIRRASSATRSRRPRCRA